MRLWLGLMIFLLASSSPCPEQTFQDWTTWTVGIDPAQIAVDPNTNRPCALGLVFARIGDTWKIRGKICDPDGDPMQLTVSQGTLVVDPNGAYTVTGPATSLGVRYITMTLVDKPPIPLDAITRKGTWVLATIGRNRPPSICGG